MINTLITLINERIEKTKKLSIEVLSRDDKPTGLSTKDFPYLDSEYFNLNSNYNKVPNIYNDISENFISVYIHRCDYLKILLNYSLREYILLSNFSKEGFELTKKYHYRQVFKLDFYINYTWEIKPAGIFFLDFKNSKISEGLVLGKEVVKKIFKNDLSGNYIQLIIPKEDSYYTPLIKYTKPTARHIESYEIVSLLDFNNSYPKYIRYNIFNNILYGEE